jgi:hypothetical protein
MNYTLITPKGKVMTFFLKVVAEQYQLAYGGVIVTNESLVEEVAE